MLCIGPSSAVGTEAKYQHQQQAISFSTVSCLARLQQIAVSVWLPKCLTTEFMCEVTGFAPENFENCSLVTNGLAQHRQHSCANDEKIALSIHSEFHQFLFIWFSRHWIFVQRVVVRIAGDKVKTSAWTDWCDWMLYII